MQTGSKDDGEIKVTPSSNMLAMLYWRSNEYDDLIEINMTMKADEGNDCR
jgi:hypothetical protein